MKMRVLALVTLCALTAGAKAADSSARPATPTVRAAGLDVRVDDIMINNKKTYVHLLWDAFPLRAAIAAKAQSRGLTPAALRALVVKALVAGPVNAWAPKVAKVKVDVVEFTERDDYGAPLMGSVQRLDHFELNAAPAKAGSK